MAKSAPPPDRATEGPSRGGKLPLILGATLILLAGGGYVAYRQMSPPPKHEEPTEPLPVVIDPGLVALDPIVANLADPSGDRYLRLTLRLMLSQKSVAAAAAADLADVKLRDAILSVLSKKRASDLVLTENKDKLRTEIARAVDEVLGKPPLAAADGSTPPCHVLEVLFTEFLLQ